MGHNSCRPCDISVKLPMGSRTLERSPRIPFPTLHPSLTDLLSLSPRTWISPKGHLPSHLFLAPTIKKSSLDTNTYQKLRYLPLLLMASIHWMPLYL